MPSPAWYNSLFTSVGSIVAAIDQIRDANTGRALMQAPPRTAAPPAVSDPIPRPDMARLRNNLQTALVTADQQQVWQDMRRTWDNFQDQATGWILTLAAKVDQLLLDREFTLNELPGLGQSPSIEDVLRSLYRAMLADGETIQRSVISIGTTGNAVRASDGTEVFGRGFLYLTLQLDGTTQAVPGAVINPYYGLTDVDSELAVPGPRQVGISNPDTDGEVMYLTCTADSKTDGLPEGSEQFLWEGQPGDGKGFDWRTHEGSGARVVLSTMDAEETIANRNFESWDVANQPTSWTIEAGTPGVHILQETATVDVFRGLNSLKFVGDGAQTSIAISQVLFGLVPNTVYLANVWVRGQAGISSGDLRVTIGDFYDVVIPAASLAGLASWTQLGAYATIQMKTGNTIPDEVRITISWEGTPSGHSLRLDGVSFGRPTWANGVGIGIVAGQIPYERGDRFSLPVLNTEGLLQRFFRRHYLFQLPSSAAPTIADSLASYEQPA